MHIRPRRSVLYMPGSNARALEKAKSLAADALILDLEDAVAPEAKEAARAQVCAAVKAGGYGHREVVIRINGLDTPWGEADLAAAAAGAPDAVLLPKPGTGADIVRATRGAGSCRRAGQDAAVGDDRDAARHPQSGRHRRSARSAPGRGSPASCSAPTTWSRRRAPISPTTAVPRSTGCPPPSRPRAPMASTCSTASTTTSRMPRASSASACTAARSASTARR